MVSGLVGIAGTGIGFMGSLLLSALRNRGKIRTAETSVSASYAEPRAIGIMNAATLAEGAHVMTYHLEALILNTYAEPKSFVVQSVDFFRRSGRRKTEVRTLSNRMTAVRINSVETSDGILPAQTFVRVHVNGMRVEAGDNSAATLRDWTDVRLSLFVAPGKTVHLWHRYEDGDDDRSSG